MMLMLSSLTPRASMHAPDAAASPVDNLDRGTDLTHSRHISTHPTVYEGYSTSSPYDSQVDDGRDEVKAQDSMLYRRLFMRAAANREAKPSVESLESISRRDPSIVLGSRSPRTPQFCDFKILEKLTRFPFTQSLGVAHG